MGKTKHLPETVEHRPGISALIDCCCRVQGSVERSFHSHQTCSLTRLLAITQASLPRCFQDRISIDCPVALHPFNHFRCPRHVVQLAQVRMRSLYEGDESSGFLRRDLRVGLADPAGQDPLTEFRGCCRRGLLILRAHAVDRLPLAVVHHFATIIRVLWGR